MRVNEITGVQRIKQSPVGVAAKRIGDTGKDFAYKETAWQRFVFELEELGFTRLGRGAYGVVFEKPGYPWVFKVFNNDPGYFTYLNFARNNQNLSAVPKIKGKFIRINDNTYAVRMEKLYPVNRDELHNLLETLRQFFKTDDPVGYQDQIDKLNEEYPDIAAVMERLTKLGKFYIDLHEENIMQREDGSLVITDPLVS